MPKPASVAKPSLPWERAVELIGHERLRAGANPSTVSNWRVRGVPWNVVGPIIADRLATRSGSDAGARQQELARARIGVLLTLLDLLEDYTREAIQGFRSQFGALPAEAAGRFTGREGGRRRGGRGTVR